MKAIKNFFGKKLRITILAAATILALLGIFSFADNDFKILKNLDIYYTLFRELNLYYVDETNPEELIKTSIDGMLESLDPYTVYIPESEMEEYKFMTTGQYGGIGAIIHKIDNNFVIAEPYEGYPAQKAGLKAGDIIHEIDGTDLSKKEFSDITELLKGNPNSEIKLVIERPGSNQLIKKNLFREKISINNVSYSGMVNQEIGYIRLSNFTEDAHVEMKEALLILKKQGAKSIIIDLRGNPGGLLIEAVEIVNLFVDKNQEIVHTKGKVKQWEASYKTQNFPLEPTMPLAVLVNRGSASASEIVAGSLQDLDRAVIIGQRTYGKGLVQTTRPLSYNGQLKVTTAKYYIPSGRCIQALDYTHREADGSVGHIPDSLIHEFSTKNGRKVYDGGGILPDVPLKPEQLNKLTYNLYTKNLIFNYATVYTTKHDSIGKLETFQLTDKDYLNFTKYLKDKNFDYSTDSEDLLLKLKTTATNENYLESCKTELEALALKLKHNKENDLGKYKNEIMEILTEEIASRYYYQKGRAFASLKNDNELQKAMEVLSNSTNYKTILSKK